MKAITQRSARRRPFRDLNMEAAGLLHDMALLQSSPRAQLGYKRAAAAIVALPLPLEDLDGARLREVRFIGPSSAKIVEELIETGTSATVDAAIARAGLRREVEARRALRRTFLSHAVMLRALHARLPASIVSRRAYRGDMQMHSTWSDGAERLHILAAACLELGHSRMGITDHSHGLPVARGMSMATAIRQQREVDRLNDRLAGRFRIYKGIEANILADGSLDLSLAERRAFEYVVASPHSLLRRAEDQTPRMLAAVRAPGVAILGHPQGRMYNSRPGVRADWEAVFAEAAARGVAIELDGNWHRQDIDSELAGRALAAGCLFALDSDAHSIPELRFSEYALAHARLARIPSDCVINCWTDRRLEDWMRERRAG